jgi:hypothetical protein
MWWRAAARDVALAAVCLTLACGRVVPAGGELRAADVAAAASAEAAAPAPQKWKSGGIEGSELIPGDLDLVLRVDLAKIRASLGPEAAKELAGRGLDSAGADGPMRAALASADVVWLGLRTAELAEGDRVLVAEFAAAAPLSPESDVWTAREAVNGVSRWEAASPAPRTGTAEILAVGRSALFVSPVEAPSVARVLKRGPDAERGEPEARGLVSIDYRPRRVAASLRKRHPPFAAVVAGVERLQAVADVTGRELLVAARFRCKNERAAEKLARFLGAFAAAGKAKDTLTELLGNLKVERLDRTVTARWPVSADALAALWRDEPRAAAP